MSHTILVVDDSPTELKLVAKALAGNGYRIVTAIDGEEALLKAVSERPALIVLDVVMPKKNGFQVCRQLKSAADTNHIKVVMLTSKTQASDRSWGLRQGADGYVTKPFTDGELLAAVTDLL